MRQHMWNWVVVATILCTTAIHAADAVGPDAAALKAARQKGAAFLKTSQSEDGSWTSGEAPGVTGLVTFGMLAAGSPVDDPTVAKALKHLETFVQPDGGIYFPKSHHANYETSICVMVFAGANKAGKYDSLLAKADKYLRGLQWDESEKTDKSDVKFGGAGYGRTGDRPDLSNTVFFLEALQATGAKKDDPAVQKALVFLSRCQNLETENNTTPFASKVNDGGFYYTPAAGGTSQAGNNPDGGLRSYGSMTYAGLKSMIFAGLTPEDERVKAATTWIKKFYTVTENPGMGQQGVYYYLQMFAKALSTMNIDQFEDAAGKKHDWRKELAEHLFSVQQPNGSWVNTNARWMEGDPNLSTAYSLMALKYCDPKPAK
ncbi:MAG: terpene cyclase/mutase family protein [Planctomycetaceae bacterium]|nr:terpene cyclase/mutase family protein [Planctomycetaceae bacterium]